MYVKIRRDGAVGIGRGTEGDSEIVIGYGEAHMIAAALEKLAQTARSYKHKYKKTTDVGKGNKIEFERSDEGAIKISGDGSDYLCTEAEIRELAKMLKDLPPVELAPASDYVYKHSSSDDKCVKIENNSQSVKLTLPETALTFISVKSSMDSRFFEENIRVGNRAITVNRSSDLKWSLAVNGTNVKFTAYEIEALVAGLKLAILEVLMDLVKSFGSDKLADIRVKSQIQRIEQDSAKLMADHDDAKSVVKYVTKMAKKVLETGQDAESRTENFVEMCRYVHANMEPVHLEPLFDLFSQIFVSEG